MKHYTINVSAGNGRIGVQFNAGYAFLENQRKRHAMDVERSLRLKNTILGRMVMEDSSEDLAASVASLLPHEIIERKIQNSILPQKRNGKRTIRKNILYGLKERQQGSISLTKISLLNPTRIGLGIAIYAESMKVNVLEHCILIIAISPKSFVASFVRLAMQG